MQLCDHLVQFPVLEKQFPHSGARVIQPKVLLCVHVEEYGFVIQPLKNYCFSDFNTRREHMRKGGAGVFE